MQDLRKLFAIYFWLKNLFDHSLFVLFGGKKVQIVFTAWTSGLMKSVTRLTRSGAFP